MAVAGRCCRASAAKTAPGANKKAAMNRMKAPRAQRRRIRSLSRPAEHQKTLASVNLYAKYMTHVNGMPTTAKRQPLG